MPSQTDTHDKTPHQTYQLPSSSIGYNIFSHTVQQIPHNKHESLEKDWSRAAIGGRQKFHHSAGRWRRRWAREHWWCCWWPQWSSCACHWCCHRFRHHRCSFSSSLWWCCCCSSPWYSSRLTTVHALLRPSFSNNNVWRPGTYSSSQSLFPIYPYAISSPSLVGVYIWYVSYNIQQSGGPQENFCSTFQAQMTRHLGVKGDKPMKKWMLTSHFCCGKNFHNAVPVVGCIVVSQRWVPLHLQQIQVAEMMPHRYTAVVGWKRRWTAELHKKTIIPDQFIYHATTSYLSVFSARGSSNKHSYKRNVGFLL